MRKIILFLFCLALFSGHVFSFQQEGYYDLSYARLNYVKGDVYIQRAEDLGYEEGTVNLPVVEGDKMGTRDGRAEIHFGKKNYLRLDRFTQVDFVRLPRRGDDLTSIHLLSGSIYLRVNLLDRERDFEVHTPDGSFYVLEEGLYRFEVLENQETAVFALDGNLEAAGEQGSELVRSGEKLIASDGRFVFGPDYVYSTFEDSFMEWNRGRDVFHNRYVRRTYLPVELYAYESELSYYGRWMYERPYGYVWVPQVYHYSWRPYYHGRWVWYPIAGWTWVSNEPWGWCVSHYGRWHWRVGLGWYWIPTRYWGPAWVHWYSGYDHIGWCPLSYHNRPVVIINNRFYGRHYSGYYPGHSRALTIVHKNQLHARHVSKVALSQTSVQRLGKISLSAKQPSVRPVVNRAGLKNSAAAKVFSQTGVRRVEKNYASGKSPGGLKKSTLQSSSSGRNSRSRLSTSKVVKTTPSKRSTRTGTAAPSALTRRSVRSSKSLKTYPSRSGISRSSAQSSLTKKRVSSSLTSGRLGSSTSRRSYSATKIKKYSPSRSLSSRSSKSNQRSFRTYGSPSSTGARRVTSQPKSRISSPSSGKVYRSSSSSKPRKFIPKITKSPYRSNKSFSPRRVSSSKMSSRSRSVKKSSPSRITRSAPARPSRASSSSRSARKVRKK